MSSVPNVLAKRTLWRAALAVPLCAAAFGAISSRTLAGKQEMVSDGMSRAQVEALLGPPNESRALHSGRDIQVLTWHEEPVTVMLVFDGMGVGGVMGRQIVYAETPTFWWKVRHSVEAYLPVL